MVRENSQFIKSRNILVLLEQNLDCVMNVKLKFVCFKRKCVLLVFSFYHYLGTLPVLR